MRCECTERSKKNSFNISRRLAVSLSFYGMYSKRIENNENHEYFCCLRFTSFDKRERDTPRMKEFKEELNVADILRP